MPLFSKQAANSLVTETSQYFVFFCRSVCSANLAKCLIINVLRLIIVILFFIAFLNITYAARHTCATLLIHQGVAITTVQKLLGHTSVKTTQIYSEILSSTIVRDLKNAQRKRRKVKIFPDKSLRTSDFIDNR
ncbi:tyrosine-type recombinase/integrase [Phocaeicola dorei]|nr:tyrosine-type recombinase/integrase [Phocaeicola dorei]